MSNKSTPSGAGDSKFDPATEGLKLLKSLKELTDRQDVKTAKGVVSAIAENRHLFKIANATPGKATVVITSVMFRKALHMTNIKTKEQTLECIEAVATLGTTAAIVAATGIPTGGLSVFLLAAGVAAQSYEVHNACFSKGGNVRHAVAAQ